jgi:hypothetical protein
MEMGAATGLSRKAIDELDRHVIEELDVFQYQTERN